MTQEQILKAIADGKFTLTTLFGKETLLADADVVAAIAEKTQAYQTAADSAQRMATERDTASTAKIAELETQIGTLTGNLTKATLKDTLAEVIGDTKLPANRQKFIDTQLTGLDIKGTTPEAIKAELQTWYTGQQTVMDSYGLPTEDAPVVPGDPNTITPPIKTPVVAPPGKTPVNDGLPPELSPTGNDLVSPEFAAVSQQIAGAGLAIKE